ncbi:hypothetical protein ABZP36_010413 [Zizania latifolia]
MSCIDTIGALLNEEPHWPLLSISTHTTTSSLTWQTEKSHYYHAHHTAFSISKVATCKSSNPYTTLQISVSGRSCFMGVNISKGNINFGENNSKIFGFYLKVRNPN